MTAATMTAATMTAATATAATEAQDDTEGRGVSIDGAGWRMSTGAEAASPRSNNQAAPANQRRQGAN
jgi:hypothetical protein